MTVLNQNKNKKIKLDVNKKINKTKIKELTYNNVQRKLN